MNREKEIQQAAIEDCELHANNRGFNSFIAGAKWADEHPEHRWISVKEGVPDRRGVVLIGGKNFLSLGIYKNGQWYDCRSIYSTPINYVTHWLPIPVLKTEEEWEYKIL